MKKEFIIERQGKSFVLYAGLLEEAHQQGLKEITTTLIQLPSPDNGNVAVCQAVVETEKGRFSGIGDADPSNVSSMMRPHIIRMAETRAKARALRDAVNVGVTALEELGDEDESQRPVQSTSVRSQESYPDEMSEVVTAPIRSFEGGSGQRSTATEKQLKAIYAIGQNTHNMTKADLEAKCKELYGNLPQDLSRWEASQLIDLLKQNKVA